YEDILDDKCGKFLCTGETPFTWSPKPIEIEITTDGPRVCPVEAATAAAATAAAAAPRAGSI
nr:metallohydrolase [Xanthomonas citri pv. citri]